jgi:hypothetical protein
MVLRRERGDGERMHGTLELIGKRRIDHAVTLESRFPGKCGGDHDDAEMAFPGPRRRSVTDMTV